MAQQVYSCGDVELNCEVRGDGEPLVLIHGFPFDHTMWEAQIDALSQVCQVIAPDLRGFGASTLASDDATQGVSMRQYALDIKALLDQLGVKQPAILCGFSMGGYVLWQLALEFPELVRAMVLCDTRADADSPEGRQGREAMATSVLQDGIKAVPGAMLPKLLAAETLEQRPEIVQTLESMIRKSSAEAIAAAQRGMAQRDDVRDRLSEFNCPALVLVGADDAISTPSEMREIADALSNSKFVEIAHAGHMTVLENPTAVNVAMQEFIASL